MVAHHLSGPFFMPPRRATSAGSLLRRWCGSAVILAMTALVVFHASILYNHFVDGRLGDPAVAFRWAIGGLLAGLLVAFHRMGVPLVRGRRALVVWVLVALLHVGAARTVASPLLDVAPEDAAAVLVIVPAAAPNPPRNSPAAGVRARVRDAGRARPAQGMVGARRRRARRRRSARSSPRPPRSAPLSSDLTCRRSACRTRSVKG